MTTTLKSRTVLKLKLDLSDEQKAVLESVAELCRVGRNVGAENWLLRQRGFPESKKQGGLGRADKTTGERKEKSESTKIYHAIREATPGLNCQIHATLAAQVNSFIRGKLDWRDRVKEGSLKYRREAILAYQMRTPFFGAIEIPAPCSIVTYSFVEKPTLRIAVNGGAPLEVACSTRQLSAGHKRILRKFASGEDKLPDSRLLKRNDEWFWFVPATFETAVVDNDKEAVLCPTIIGEDYKPTRQSDRPFGLNLPSGRTWYVGDGEYLKGQTSRFIRIIKEIGWRYRQRCDAGHGRNKIDAAVRKRRKELRNIVDEFRRRVIRDVVRQCQREGVGKVLYREPSLPLREKCWFAANGLEFDWTRFFTDLKNACAKPNVRIVVVKERWKLKDAA